jgi:hypothetical protein
LNPRPNRRLAKIDSESVWSSRLHLPNGLATGAFGIAARVFQAAAKNREICAGHGPFGSLTPFRKPFTVNMLL